MFLFLHIDKDKIESICDILSETLQIIYLQEHRKETRMSELITLSIPFLGTSLGAAMVFFLKDKIAPRIEKLLLGFAAGVMIAASVWSLLIPGDRDDRGTGEAWRGAGGDRIFARHWFLLVLDTVIPHLHLKSSEPEGLHAGQPRLSKTTMMLFAVTLHNIPEGMSVGLRMRAV